MDRIRRGSQQIHGLQQTVVGVDQHHLRRLGISIRKADHLHGVVREVAPHHSWVEGMPATQLLSVAISLDGKAVGSQIALSLKEVIYSRGLGAWLLALGVPVEPKMERQLD
jgi:hypothetical protein